MLEKILATATFCVALHFARGQSIYTTIGARAAGLGYASSCVADEWALFNNIGGLSGVTSPIASVAYDARPAIPGSDRMAIVAATPALGGTVGVGIFRFGDNVYNEHVITAGFSNTFGITSLGLQLNYVQYKAEGIGSKGVVSLNVGGITKITPQISVGAYIVNLNQPKLSTQDEEHLPTLLLVGFAFTPTDKIFIATEIEKDLDYPATWKTGVEYHIVKKFLLRTGFNLYPNAGFLGFGFRPNRLLLDYALHFQPVLGLNHQLSLGYKIKGK